MNRPYCHAVSPLIPSPLRERARVEGESPHVLIKPNPIRYNAAHPHNPKGVAGTPFVVSLSNHELGFHPSTGSGRTDDIAGRNLCRHPPKGVEDESTCADSCRPHSPRGVRRRRSVRVRGQGDTQGRVPSRSHARCQSRLRVRDPGAHSHSHRNAGAEPDA